MRCAVVRGGMLNDVEPSRRFPIRFDPAYRVLSSALLLAPSRSFVDVGRDAVTVRMAWGFRARLPRAAVSSASPHSRRPLSRGVHGFAGRWLVNGSGDGIVEISLAPRQRGYVMGIPVRLKTVLVSVEDPAGLIAALGDRCPGSIPPRGEPGRTT